MRFLVNRCHQNSIKQESTQSVYANSCTLDFQKDVSQEFRHKGTSSDSNPVLQTGAPIFPVPATPAYRRTSSAIETKTSPVGIQRLINLSYSQPSTPKTPFCHARHTFQTPRHIGQQQTRDGYDGFVINTPMIASSLQVLDSTFSGLNPGPDILQMIEDEHRPIEAVDNQLKIYSETELTDETVVQYLLDLASEHYEQQSACLQPNTEQFGPAVQEDQTRWYRRKGRRAKPASMEELESLRRISKENQKEKRKQRFKLQVPKGTRKSGRVRRQTELYRC